MVGAPEGAIKGLEGIIKALAEVGEDEAAFRVEDIHSKEEEGGSVCTIHSTSRLDEHVIGRTTKHSHYKRSTPSSRIHSY
jgi:hypothetical protein